LLPDDKRNKVINRKQQCKAKTDYGKPDKNPGVQMGLGYPSGCTQGKKQNIYGTDTVHHDKDKQHLGYPGFPSPIERQFHGKFPPT
jgi:hypothetical protein